MQWPDLFRAAYKRSDLVAAAIVKIDDVAEGRSLAVPEIRPGLGDLPQAFCTPEAIGNCLSAERTVAFDIGIVAEVPGYLEIAAWDGGVQMSAWLAARPRSVGSACGDRVLSMCNPMM